MRTFIAMTYVHTKAQRLRNCSFLCHWVTQKAGVEYEWLTRKPQIGHGKPWQLTVLHTDVQTMLCLQWALIDHQNSHRLSGVLGIDLYKVQRLAHLVHLLALCILPCQPCSWHTVITRDLKFPWGFVLDKEELAETKLLINFKSEAHKQVGVLTVESPRQKYVLIQLENSVPRLLR